MANAFLVSRSGLQSVIAGMKEYSTDIVIQDASCTILWNIAAAYKENRMTIQEHVAIKILVNAMEIYKIDQAKNAIQRLLEND